MSAYESIVEGLHEAITFTQGQDTGAQVHRIAVPQGDVAKATNNE